MGLRRSRTSLWSLTAAVVLAGVLVSGGLAVGVTGAFSPSAVTASEATAFVGLSPRRVLDTRVPIGVATKAPLGEGQTLTLALRGQSGIGADALSVALNVTLDADATSKSFLTIWPTGEERPNSSADNAEPGLIAPNLMVAKLGADGSISVFNERGAVNVIIDVVGYFVPLADVQGNGSRLLSGAGAPAPSTGASGDFYIDTATGDLYGPKVGGAWGPPLLPGRSALNAYNDAGVAQPTVTPGSPIPFNTAGVSVGTAIVKSSVDTFTLTQAGTYRVHYRISTAAASLLGGVAVQVNGSPVGPTTTLGSAGSILSDSILVTTGAGDTLRLVAQGLTLTLSSGTSASILIERAG